MEAAGSSEMSVVFNHTIYATFKRTMTFVEFFLVVIFHLRNSAIYFEDVCFGNSSDEFLILGFISPGKLK